jgi:hypothetical protein
MELPLERELFRLMHILLYMLQKEGMGHGCSVGDSLRL